LIRLDHPNVVRIIDAGQWDDWIYVVEEWLRGTTLRRFMLERGRVPRKEALELAVQMLAGLGAAHAAKIVHRDLKPENVFVTETGAVKLLDFGLAKSMDASGSSSRGLLVGTPGYMAPERLMPLPERVKNDPRADLFSFGVILYEMLAGAHPYKFGRKRLSAEQLALYMASFDPPVLAAEPLELWKLIARTISRYPDERPASADIIVRELRRILAVPALPVAPPDRSGRSQLVAAVARSVLAGTLAGTAIGYSAFAVERSLWPPQHNEDARLHADERASAASAPTPAPSLAAPPEPARTQATPAPARPPAEAATTNPKPEKPPRERRVAARAKTPVPKPSAPTPASRSSDAIRELLETPIFDDDPQDAP
jgi:serine/threonine-protein kinase